MDLAVDQLSDGTTVAFVGVGGAVLVAVVTGLATVLSARTTGRREQAIRADERQQERDREDRQRADAEAERQRQQQERTLAYRREVASRFVAQAQTVRRSAVFAAADFRAGGSPALDQAAWEALSERLGAVMLAFPAVASRPANQAVDALQDALIAMRGTATSSDRVDELLDAAAEHLDAFTAAVGDPR